MVKLHKIEKQLYKDLSTELSIDNGLIVLGKNESTGRALWEIGYELQNLLVQAASLGISYKAVLLDVKEKRIVREAGVEDPVAVLVI